MYHYSFARTQKAKSILLACPVLQHSLVEHCLRFDYSIAFKKRDMNFNKKPLLFTSLEEIDKFMYSNPNFWSFTDKVFARPCPLTPRHGFVDSRLIFSHEELQNLFNEVLSADQAGEVILSQFIDNPTYNAVLTSSGNLAIGPGHDGATSGKSCINLSVAPQKISKYIMSLAGLSSEDNTFIEAVFSPRKDHDLDDNMSFYITQVRGGPAVPTTQDFIPKKMKVDKIIKPINDLLVWEDKIKKLAPNTVVYAPGHTLSSHAAIHCVINNVPFITSFQPTINSVIVPNSNQKIVLNSSEFMNGVFLGLSSHYPLRIMLHISATVLHNWVYLRSCKEASWLLGIASSYMSQVLLALCLGEYRHSKGKNKFRSLGRDGAYNEISKHKKFLNYIHRVPFISKSFRDRVKFPASEFGGIKWAYAIDMSANIWNAIIKIQNNGMSSINSKRLIDFLNKAINLVHNGGWLFNKVSHPDRVENISRNPNLAALELSDYIYELYVDLQKIKTNKKLSPVKQYKKTIIKSGR